MASTQQFFLRWNNYLHHITYAFDSLRSQEDFVDVTLSCEGKKIRAHKVLLSACSTYFREVFKDNPCPHPVIVFKNVRYEDLLAIVEFMYQGEVNVVQESLPSFLNTAELLAVQGLTEGNSNNPNDKIIHRSNDDENNSIPIKNAAEIIHKFQTKPHFKTTPVQQFVTTKSSIPQNIIQGTISSSAISCNAATISSDNISVSPQIKRKRFIIDQDDNIKIEGLNFLKQNDQNTITIEEANVEYIPAPMKIEIPEYIDITEGESGGGGGDDGDGGGNGNGNEINNGDDGTNVIGIDDGCGDCDQDQLLENETIKAQSPISCTDENYEQEDNEDHHKEKYTINSDMDGNYHTETLDVQDNNSSTVEIGQILPTSSQNNDKLNSLQDVITTNKWSQCQFCKIVITTVNLWRHIRTQHTPQPPRRCELCQKNFKNKYSLREHIRIAHEQKSTQKV